MAKKPTPKKKAASVKTKSKKVSKPAAKKTVAKKVSKPAAKKTVIKKTVKPAAKKPVAKSKPANKPKAKIIVKKPVKSAPKKPAPKKQVKVKKPVIKKIQVKKTAAKKPVVKAKIVPVKKVATAKHKTVKKARSVPIKLPQLPESNYNRADMFYKNVLKAEIIKRYSHKKDEDKELLGKDINLHVKMNDKETTISEKMRDQDWNDIYVEIYKKYPDEAGWIKFTEAEYLAYFFPGRVFFSKMEPIRNLCQDILCRAVNTGIFKDMYYMFFRSSGRHSQSIKINNKTYSFTFHQTYHDEGENSHYSIGLILPFVMLMDFRIDYKIFKQ